VGGNILFEEEVLNSDYLFLLIPFFNNVPDRFSVGVFSCNIDDHRFIHRFSNNA
jgi:hypothetical protein